MNRRLVVRLCAVIIGSAVIAPVSLAQEVIKMSTTTSTENSGLLTYLLPKFEAKTNSKVQVIAVGTGKALELAKNGDVDVTLVHARPAEDKFVAEGYGVNRRDVMYNDFIIVGPENDPAGLKGSKDVIASMKKLHQRKPSSFPEEITLARTRWSELTGNRLAPSLKAPPISPPALAWARF